MARGPSKKPPATAAASVERFKGKGIIAWEVDGVLARFTKGQSAKFDDLANLIPLVDIGAELAVKIRKRVTTVAKLGDVGGDDQFQPYGKKARYPVSAQYAQAAGAAVALARYWLTREDMQARKAPIRTAAPFTSSARFHEAAGTRPGTFLITGGMWKGLQARASGKSAVILDFQGSSVGVGKTEKKQVWGWRGRKGAGPEAVQFTLRYATPGNVRNSEKATMVAKMSRVHVLRPRNLEIAAIQELVNGISEQWAANALEFDAGPLALPRLGGDTELRSRLAALVA